ncbi:MAG: carboxypeptidase regulatory-like domain-containing protein [Proteobacteria bacterium]|nr:carboxypeptidase regulatory-like domain-containing protein [Pseudomonadota bacterium]
MKNKSQRTKLLITALRQVSIAAFAAVMLLAVPVAGNAQETRSEIRGSLSAPDGGPAVGVSVQITDSRTGRSSSTTTSDSGRFFIGNLAVGGPYSIFITSQAYATQTITEVNLSLGETFIVDLSLRDSAMDEIIVTATVAQAVQVALGPSSTFSFDDIQNAPTINRDIIEVVRLDPRVYIDVAFRNGVQCVGANPRFNSITVDGVKQNDNFGLNSNGYPTERMPFPFDAIQNVALELSPYDVQYGGFTACNINAVTRSGTNEFHGNAWFTYGDDSLRGDKLEGDKLPPVEFDETRYGVSFGGPIVKNKLFFFAAYEKWDGANLFDRCAGDQVCGRSVLGVSQAQLDRIRDIAVTQYDFDPGETVSSLPTEDEKFLARFDWNINDDHNASLTYIYNDGFNWSRSDNDADEFEFSNHLYERGAELNSWSGQWFANWTDTFNTEMRVGVSTLDNRQLSRGQGFGEMRIETYFDGDGDGVLDRANVYLGGDDSRQSNKLDYETFNFKLAANWAVGDHLLTAGLEREEIEIFNLFVQQTVGEYRFDENRTDINGNPVGCSNNPTWSPSGCIDQFEALSPDDTYYGNAPSLNPDDASALFSTAVNTFYVQDEFILADGDLTIVAGLRYDWYTSDDLPRANSDFLGRTGFTNSQNFDGESLVQPRLGLTWNASDTLIVRGGIGLYSGGNPNVWLSNNYSNDGFTAVQAREFNDVNGFAADMNVDPSLFLGSADIPLGVDGNGRPGYDAPQGIIQFVSSGSANVGVNGIDPGFKIPANWKYSLGATWTFGDGYVLSGDFIYSQAENSAIIRDDTQVQTGTAPDGRPIYYATDRSIPGCVTDPFGTGPVCDRLFNSDFILDNVIGSDSRSTSLSATLAKDHDNGLSWLFGYAYTESDDVSPMTSSVAFSNWFFVATPDVNDPGRATSNYEIPHRFILRVNYEKNFFRDLTTRFSLFGSSAQGRPYSATFRDQAMFLCGPFFCPSDDRHLLYMPDGPSDPLVQFDPGFDQAGFFAWAAENDLTKYGGGIVPRNSIEGAWWTKFDLRVSQDLPGFSPDHSSQVYFTIQNIGNLLNDDWGVLEERSFPRTADAVEASISGNQYVFEEFTSQTTSRVASASLWTMRFGFNYRF